MARATAVVLAAMLAVGGCSGQPSPSGTTTPAQTPTQSSAQTSPTATPDSGPTAATASPAAAPPAHRIAVRDGGDGRELYDTTTGASFRARGVNLLRLERFGDRLYDTLFGSHYDAAWVDSELDRLAEMG